MKKQRREKVKRGDWLHPDEKDALKSISAAGHKAEAKVLGDSIIKWKKMLRTIFNKLKGVMEEYSE